MKNIVENGEVFEAYARISYCYYALEQVGVILGKEKLASPIERMVDQATGFAEHQLQETKKTIIGLMEQVIKDKKFIETDTKADEEFLAKIKNGS